MYSVNKSWFKHFGATRICGVLLLIVCGSLRRKSSGPFYGTSTSKKLLTSPRKCITYIRSLENQTGKAAVPAFLVAIPSSSRFLIQ